jgi:hypothetical protein
MVPGIIDRKAFDVEAKGVSGVVNRRDIVSVFYYKSILIENSMLKGNSYASEKLSIYSA